MNVFRLARLPHKAAQAHNDIHVNSQLGEACQVLSTAHPEKQAPRKHTHFGHPCAVWVRASVHNYIWLARLAVSLADEFEYRRNKQHAYAPMAQWLLDNVPFCHINGTHTPFAQAMPDIYKREDSVAAYRLYYIAEKFTFAKHGPATWTRRKPPNWWIYNVTEDTHATSGFVVYRTVLG